MKCEICNKVIDYSISFKDLFVFKFICESCINEIDTKYTIIPINNGYNLYFYYFLFEDKYIKESSKYITYKIFNLIKNVKNKLVLFYDEDEIEFVKILEFNEDIILINNLYVELENVM